MISSIGAAKIVLLIGYVKGFSAREFKRKDREETQRIRKENSLRTTLRSLRF
jgi:hypothetical protein